MNKNTILLNKFCEENNFLMYNDYSIVPQIKSLLIQFQNVCTAELFINAVLKTDFNNN